MEKNLLSKKLNKTFINVLSSLGFGLLLTKYSSKKESTANSYFLNKTKYAFFVALFGVLFGVQDAQSQTVSSYTFAQTAGTYTAITGGTLAVAAATDDAVGSLINIGFTFTYHGVAFTQFAAGTNGYIQLGAATSTTIPSGYANMIMYMGGDGKTGTTAPTYLLSGTSPNRVLTVQFPVQWVYYTVATDAITAQIKLYETTNVIQIVYGASAHVNPYARSVGIVGAATTDYSTRVSTFAASTAGTSAAATMPWSATVFPASGLTYTWTPPSVPAPTITSLGASSGCAGGTLVINGTNFTGATAANIKIGGIAGSIASITSNTGTVLTVVTAATATSGTVSVTTSGGTATSAATYTVSPLPVAAGTITGTATVCQGASGVSYSVPAITNATSYTWAYSGTGATISGSTNSVTIAFSASATGGNLKVQGTNTCGSGTVSAAYAITVTPTVAAASTPSPATAATGVCYAGGGSVSSVSWSAAAGATSYAVYFGAGSLPGSITSTVATTSYSTGTLLASTTYYWKVVPINSCGSYGSPVTWTFTTASSPCALVYCASAATSTADEEIYSVTVNGATNALGCGVAAPGAGSVAYLYSNFTTLGALTSVTPGQTVSFSIAENECDGATYYTNGCAIWIDYNQNGLFTDAGEQVYTESGLLSSPRTIASSFVVPAVATIGTTRMRITVAEGYSGSTLTPCLSYIFGETEDYNITISNAPVISSFSPKTGCTIGASNVTITGVNMASATSVTFNGVAGTIVSNSATSIVVTPPSGVTTGNIIVTTAGGSGTSATPYAVVSFTAPTVANTGGGCSSTALNLTANGLAPGSGGVTLASASSQYLITPDLASFSTTKDITLEIWFKANAAGVIISEQGAAPLNAGWHDSQLEILASGEVKVSVWAGASSPVSIGTVSFGTWNHAVVRYNSATSILDGLLNGVPSVPVTITRATPNSASPFFTNLYYGIGNVDTTAITGGTGAYFDGQVDEFRVWNTALSTANIDSWMTREVTASHPNYANLVAYYKMNTGAMLVDSKTGTYPLTAVASPVSTVSSYYTYSWAGPSGATNPTASTLETQAGNTGSGAFPQTWTLTTTSPLGCTIPTTTTTNSIGTASTAPTSASVSPATYCLPPATITLTATGGSPGAGAVLTWTSGSCGGTVVGTGSPLTIAAPSATTTYYAKYVSCVGTTLCVSTTVTLSPLAPPTAGTASPSTVCAGATVNLSAISAGNSINWYNAASGGTLLNGSPIASGGTFAVTPSISPTTTYYAQAVSTSAGTPTTATFNYSGSIVNWTVPAGVTSITVNAKGAQGGTSSGSGGLGANMTGTFAVTPGQVLSILAGQQPAVNSYPGGGGGTYVALGASYSSATPLIVAGGGGGAQSGSGNNASISTSGNGPLPGTSGNGAASSSCGGGGGGFFTSGGNDLLYGTAGAAGAGFQQGGAGGISTSGYGPGGFGGGASADYDGSCNVVGGSGGGYSGGSGTGTAFQLFGYGGGSYNAGTSQTNTVGNSGNGIVTITYTSVIVNCVSAVLTPVTVNVNQYPVISVQPVAPAAFCAASTATASVTATGAVSYQWQVNGVNISGAPYSGYSSNTLTITNPTSADNGAVITCVITGAGGCATTTTSFTIVVNTTPAAPTGVTASSSTICVGQSVNLSATVSTGSINWYNSTGTLIGSTASGANLPVSPTTTTTYQAEATSAVVGSATFSYTGAVQTFTVPAGVTSIHVQVVGAQGGNTLGYTPLGGSGAKMEGDITVTPGQVLKVLAGGQGIQGTTSSGGGGGGGSFVTTSTNAPLIIAGGGGGVAVSTSVYTPVGADAVTTTSGVNGYSGLGGTPGNYGIGGTAGSGATGTSSCGGNGGGLLSNGIANASCCSGTFGYGFVNGAAGGTVCTTTGNGGFGGGGGGGNTAGGGGGGYSGGGASWNNPTNGGGGGSYNAGINQVNIAGFNASGNGYVVISYSSGAGCLSTQVPVTVTVNPIPAVSITSASPVSICSGSSTLLSATGATSYTWMPGSLTGSDVTVSPTTATTYTVTGSSSGCTGPTQTVSVTVNANPVILSATASPNPVCSGNILDLATTTTTTATSYVVSSIPYGFIPPGFFGLSPTTVYTAPTGPDDGVTSGIALPFTFTYYGVPYTSINISSNGNIQFSSALNTWTPSTIPTVGVVDNFVGGPMMDLNFLVGTGTLKYVTYGSAPNRVFIIAWENVTIYGTSDLETSEIMLYEADNSIETHIGGAGINAPALVKAIGIEGPGGTAGLAAPGRNASTWVTTLNESYRFALNSLTYSWAGPNSFTSSIANPSLTTSAASAGTYSVTVTDIFGCTASATTAAVVINSATAPTATNSSQCGPGIPTCSVTSTVGVGGEFYWYNAATSGTLVQAPPLSTYYTNTFASSATPATLSGVAAITGGVCRLHTNIASQQGGITVPASGFSTVQLDVQFDATTSGTAGNMADGFSYSFAPNADATLTSYGQEQGTGSKLRISFDAYGSSGANMQGIYLLYNQTGTSFNPTLGGAVLGYSGNTSWLNSNQHYTITINTSGQLSLSLGATAIFTNIQLPADYLTANKATWKHVIAGRTGGSSMQTDLDNLVIKLALSGSTTFLSSISGTTTWYVSETATNGCISPLTAVTETVNPIPTVTTANTATICSGNATSISLAATVTSSFTWTVGTITGSITGASAGSGTTIAQTLTNPSSSAAGTVQYIVTPTSTTGTCAGSAYTITVTVNPRPTVTASASATTVCAGTAVTLTGGGASTYSWTGGVTNGLAFTPTSTTTYTVTGTSAAGCSATASVTVTVNPIPTVTASASATSVCAGTAVTLTGAGASTYSWTAGVTDGLAFVPTATTTYTVTGTSAAGCSSTASVAVTVNPIPTVTASASATTVCAGTAVTLTGAGASTYSWTAGVTNGLAFTPAATSTYTVTGTSAAGCSATASVTVTVNPIPTVTASASATSVCAGTAVTLTGAGASTYSWTAGVTNGLAFTPTATSTYTVTGTSAAGCSATASVTVTVNPIPTVTASASATSVCAGTAVTLTGAGASTYSWTAGVTNGLAFTPTATSTYTVTGTSAAGCSATASVTVTVNPIPTVTASASATSVCAGTAVTLTGAGASTYSWTAGVTDGLAFVPTATTTYTVTGTSAAGCSSTASVAVTVNPIPTVTASASATTVCAGTAVTLTGAGASTYSWTAGVTNGLAFTPAATSTYTVTGTSAAGCSATASVTVTVNPIPTVTASASATSVCAGTAVTLTGAGASTYSWTAGVTNGLAFTPTATSTYTVTGTSAAGCSSTASVAVTVNPIPTVTASASATTVCAGTAVTLTGAGASTYSWTAGVTNGLAFTPTSTSTYTVTGTSAAGCSATASVAVTVNPIPTVTASASATSVCAGTAVTLTGAGASTYSWTAGVTNGLAFTPTSTSTYTVTGTSAAGCSATASVAVTVNPIPTVSCPSNISVSATTGSCSAIVTYSASSSTIPSPTITYSPASGSSFNIGTTIVTATATTSGGCVSTCTFTVTVTSSGTSNWLGSISNDWFNSGNWCGGIPTATSDAVISTGAPYMPIISTTGAIAKNITINSGASLTMNGNGYLTVVGNWINNGTFTATAGDVNFNGSSSQTLTGATYFFSLDLNNPNGLIINSDVNVNGGCHLVSGILTTGSNVLQITNGASLSSTSGYVNGYLKKYINVGNYYSTFEVGSLTAYTPANINFNNVLSAGYLTVNTISSDHPSISSSGLDATKTINRYWNLVGSGLTFDYYDMDMTYALADKDAGFIDIYVGAKIYSGSTWNLTAPNFGTANSLSIGSVNTLGSIQIGIFNPTPLAISLSPNYGYIGLTSTIVFNGRGFISGATSVNSVAGVTINSTTVNNDSTMTLNISVSSAALAGIRKFAITNITNAPGYGGGTSDSLDFTIRNNPVASFFANRSSIVCNVSGNVEFNNYSTDGTSYYWDFGAGASPATASGYGPYTVMYSTTGLKTVKLVVYSPLGNDSLTRVNYITVTSSVPSIPASISGPLNITCTSSPVTNAYSAPLLADVSYNWTVPAGATITSGLGTHVIVVTFSGTFTSGTISLSESNGCGTSPLKSIAVSKAPPAPGAISGSTAICGLSSSTYSIAAVSGATSYTWILPTGVTSSIGTSPIITSVTSLPVVFASTFTSGTISVTANNACASSAARAIAISAVPAIPASITGTLTGLCPSGVSSATYTCAAVVGATSYLWTVPTGATITAGAGTTSVTVSFGATFTSGNISVQAVNACGNSTAKLLAVRSTLLAPLTLTGTLTGLCPSGVSSATYTCAAVVGATSYLWTAPTGATITAGAGTTSVTVSFDATFTSGNISVQAVNACGNSTAKLLAVRSTLLAPLTLTGTLTGLCPSGVSSATYTCAAVVGATSYLWTAPTGATITAGAGTTSVTVSFDATFTSGNISVQAVNACGNSTAKLLAVRSTLLAPTTLTGTTTGLCPSGVASAVYTCSTVVGATGYKWTAPAGAAVTAGQGTTTATISFTGLTSGNISVVDTNACGSSPAKLLAVRSTLLAPTTLTGTTTGLCPSGVSSATYTCAAVVGATSYLWTVPTGATVTAGAGTTSATVSFDATFTSGNISVQAVNACGNSVAKLLAVRSTLLAPGLITGSTNVCGVATTTYSVAAVTGATGYKWTVPVDMTITSGQGTSSINVSIVSGPGATLSNYTLSVKDTNACGESASKSLTVQNCHSYSAFSADSSDITNLDILLYPNPTSDNFNIAFTSDIESKLIFEMYDIQGKIILSKVEIIAEGQNLFSYNVEELKKGIYFIKLTDEQNKMLILKKLVVQ